MDMISVTSSQIASIGHDPATGKYRVRFVDRTSKKDGTVTTGGLYEYDDVPASVHEAMIEADRNPALSVGTHFGRLIKGGGYTYRRIEEGEDQ
jgi:hypothetical protein